MSVSKTLQQARSLSRRGDIAGAMSLYREVLGKFPKNKDAKRGLLELSAAPSPKSQAAAATIFALREHLSRGELNALLSKVKPALRSFPDEAELHNIAGIALASEGQHRAAASHYQSALKLHPGYANAPVSYTHLRAHET